MSQLIHTSANWKELKQAGKNLKQSTAALKYDIDVHVLDGMLMIIGATDMISPKAIVNCCIEFEIIFSAHINAMCVSYNMYIGSHFKPFPGIISENQQNMDYINDNNEFLKDSSSL